MLDTGRTVSREVTIEAPVGAVWKALTDARELERWFPPHAEVDRAAGTIRLQWGDAYDAVGPIEAWAEGEHLRFRFPKVGEVTLATDYYLERDGTRTRLRVVSSGFGAGDDWDEAFDGVSRGWEFELYSLRHYLERHAGRDRRVIQVVEPYGASEDAAWSAVLGSGGLFHAGLSVASGRWTGVTEDGIELSGEVVRWEPPRQFVGRVANWNDGLFRVEMESDQGPGRAWVQASTWAVPAVDMDRLASSWRGVLHKRLAGQSGQAAPGP